MLAVIDEAQWIMVFSTRKGLRRMTSFIYLCFSSFGNKGLASLVRCHSSLSIVHGPSLIGAKR